MGRRELKPRKNSRLSFYEFFAGGGMVRAGLGSSWRCLFANDIDEKKNASYTANWGRENFKLGDVKSLTTQDLPDTADLAWASFPCQDLSLAGLGAGLNGERSGTFWAFWRLILSLSAEKRAPTVIVLENVCGALTSHDGTDFRSIAAAFKDGGYRFGSIVMDAALFVPQSRPRLFVIAVRREQTIPRPLERSGPTSIWHPASLRNAHANLPGTAKSAWLWWSLPEPPDSMLRLGDIIQNDPEDVRWHTSAETERLLSLMNPLHAKKIEHAARTGARMIGCVYRRTRRDASSGRVQRAEIRFDGLAGCLRTPAGGSSRQSIVVVEGANVRSRLLSSREAARLMGLPDEYRLPSNYNDAYHLAGDGVVVPVVDFLATRLLKPLLSGRPSNGKEAA